MSLYLFRYNQLIIQNFLLGFSLFLLTEILIFIGLFVSWFYCGLNPSIWLGAAWAPEILQEPTPFFMPLYGTIILFISSCSLMWFELVFQLRFNSSELANALTLTIGMGIHFIGIQILEFSRLPFSFSDSIFSNLFFTITGLHLIHILIGLILLATLYCRLGVR